MTVSYVDTGVPLLMDVVPGEADGSQLKGEYASLVADHLPICIGYVDADRKYRYVNRRYHELFSLAPEQILGRSVEEVVGLDNYRAVVHHIDAALRGDRRDFKTTADYAEIGRRTCQFNYIPHQIAEDLVAGYFVLVSDITSQSEALEATREREERIRLITDNIPVMISYTDAEGRYLFVNRVYTDYFGLSSDQVVGRHWTEIIGAENAKVITPRFASALRGETVSFEDELTLPDGRNRHMRGVHLPHIENGRVKGIFALREDITELRQTIDALEVSERQLKLIADNVPAVICYVDNEERYRFANRVNRDWFGHTDEEIIGKTLEEVLDPAVYLSIRPNVRAVLAGERVEFQDLMTEPSGEERHAQVVYEPRIEGGHVVGFYVFRTDVTALKRAEAKARHLATHDSLTGLPNRRFFEGRFLHAAMVAKRHPKTLATLLIDLDGFKGINDEHGHEAGDLVLKSVADRLDDVCRETDSAARLGGDEYIVLMETSVTLEGAVILAKKINHALEKPIPSVFGTLKVGASIGIALAEGAKCDVEEMLRMADRAMYAAKQSGRAFAVYSELAAPDLEDPFA